MKTSNKLREILSNSRREPPEEETRTQRIITDTVVTEDLIRMRQELEEKEESLAKCQSENNGLRARLIDLEKKISEEKDLDIQTRLDSDESIVIPDMLREFNLKAHEVLSSLNTDITMISTMAEIEIKELSGLLEMVGEEAHGELVRTTEAMSTAQLKKITFKKRMMEYLLDL